MPVYNGINTDALEEFARRFLGIRQGGIMPSLSPEPSVAVNYPTLPDQLALAGYIPFGMGRVVGGVAAQFGAVSIVNNTTQQLMVLELGGSVGANAVLNLSMGPSLGLGLIASTSAGWRDGRRLQSSFPLNANGVVVQDGTLAAVPPGAHFIVGRRVALATTFVDCGWVVLPPGQGAALWCDTANVALNWEATGFLRDALPDELTGI